MKERFVSTGGAAPAAALPSALFRSLAPDGGLYLPEDLPSLSPAALKRVLDPPWPAGPTELARVLLPEIPSASLESIVSGALSFPIPLVEVEPGRWVLELFHGPTLAFKDVGARFMARLFSHLDTDSREPLTVLAATSGDTGSAVAQAFLGVPGTRVAILYPEGKVSPVQECQFTTLGENVQALAVAGTFDDCQRLVKAAFADAVLARRLRLTSANSINLGRLLPQSFYYFHAVSQLPAGSAPPVFAVPSGNFGNLTAGVLAHRLGLPMTSFIAATNANDVVPRFLESGIFRPRPSIATISNAMDVGNPSNFDRIRHLFGGDGAAMGREIEGFRSSDEETRGTIRAVFERTGYVLDPHTAIGYRALERLRGEAGEDRPGIVLATAHPVKFREHVEPLIGRKIPVPKRLAQCLDRPRRSLPLAPEEKALKGFLEAWRIGP